MCFKDNEWSFLLSLFPSFYLSISLLSSPSPLLIIFYSFPSLTTFLYLLVFFQTTKTISNHTNVFMSLPFFGMFTTPSILFLPFFLSFFPLSPIPHIHLLFLLLFPFLLLQILLDQSSNTMETTTGGIPGTTPGTSPTSPTG